MLKILDALKVSQRTLSPYRGDQIKKHGSEKIYLKIGLPTTFALQQSIIAEKMVFILRFY